MTIIADHQKEGVSRNLRCPFRMNGVWDCPSEGHPFPVRFNTAMKTQTYTPDRRPLGAREWKASHAAAAWLVARKVPPNGLSITGMFASLGAGAALAATSTGDQPGSGFVIACLLILLRGMCNMLDGMVAVTTGKASPAGELFNEVPDRISDSVILVGAGYGLGGIPELGFVAALAAVFSAYVRVQGCALGTEADFSGPMAKTHRMFVVVAAALYTALLPAAWQPAVPGIPRAGMMAFALAVVIAGCAVTAVRRLRRTARTLAETKP
jgi:phosphatidylglycerophosphate synthase